MKKTALLQVTLLVGLLSFPHLAAQPQNLESLDSYIRKGLQDWSIPGLAIAVVKDGEVVFERGYGVRELGQPDPVTPETLFAIGSTTKAMTAVAVGILVDEGKLKWDDPVSEYLPTFQLYDPFLTREVTVRDLLTHRTGLGNSDFLWYGQDHSQEEILRRMRFLKPQTSMRSQFIYQNVMYAAAGEVIRVASGLAWKDFVDTRIFTPLKMHDSLASLADFSGPEQIASPHHKFDDSVKVIEPFRLEAIAPAGSVYSHVRDLSQWMLFLLNEARVGETSQERLLETVTLAELFRPQVIVPRSIYPTIQLIEPHWTTYGLGWFQLDYQGRAVDFHTGSIDGMSSILGLIRDEELGVCILINRDHAELRHALMLTVFDLFDEAPPVRDWSQDLQELYREREEENQKRRRKIEQQRISGTQPSVALENYAGSYSNPLFGTVEIGVRDDDSLWFKYGSGFRGPLEHWHYDTFRVEFEARWRGQELVIFSLDDQGKVSRVEVRGASFDREKVAEKEEEEQ